MDGQPCPTSNAQQLRVVQQLLWDVISHHLYPAERDEIRRALGNSLLYDNEAMFAEAAALAEILGDVQLNTTALLARHQLCSNPQRSMVESEIRLLIDRLHSTANATPYGSVAVRDRDPDSLLPRSGKRDKAVLDYMTTVAQIAETGGRPPSSTGLPPRPPTSLSGSSRPGTSSRPPTALSTSASITLPSPLSRPGTASPTTLNGSRPSTASSAASSAATRYTDAPSVVAGVADKLSIASIEAVRDTLRSALQDERVALLEDIDYLQGLLEAEADLQVRAAAPPPSLTELKDYSSRLAAVVADEESRLEHEVRVSAMFAAADQQAGKPGRLRGMVDASRRPTSGGSGSAGAASPSAAVAGAATAMASPSRRSASSGGAGGGGSCNVQTLVVHGGEEEAVRQQTPPAQQQQQRRTSLLAEVGGTSGTAAAAAGATTAVRVPAAPLAAVRRPSSSGTGTGTGFSSDASPLPPVLPPPTASRPLGAAAPLPAVRTSPAAAAAAAPGGASPAAASHPTHRPDSNGVSSSPASSFVPAGRLRQASPGRALQPVGGAAAGQASGQRQGQGQGHGISSVSGAPPLPGGHGTLHGTAQAAAHSHPHGQPHAPTCHDRSPSLAQHGAAVRGVGTTSGQAHKPGVGATSGQAHKPGLGGAAAAALPSSTPPPVAAASATSGPAPSPGLRGLLPRSGTADRRAGAAPTAANTAMSMSVGAGRTGSRSNSAIEAPAASKSVTASPSKAAAAAAVTPGGAVAARLGGSAGAVPEPHAAATAVQPRALLGNKQSVVERLDAEVDAVKGGVAAILERYNIRPSTPTTPPAAAAATAPDPMVAAATAAARGTARAAQ